MGGHLGPLIEETGIVHPTVHDPQNQMPDCVDDDDAYNGEKQVSLGLRAEPGRTMEPVPEPAPRSPKQLPHRPCEPGIRHLGSRDLLNHHRWKPSPQCSHAPSSASASEGTRVPRAESREPSEYPKDFDPIATSATRREGSPVLPGATEGSAFLRIMRTPPSAAHARERAEP